MLSNEKKLKKDYLFLFLKGAGMGAADIVPGVSGGTIAFITGIYARLLQAINNVNLTALSTLKNKGIRATWLYIDGAFLLSVFSGLLISAISLAKVITYFLTHHPLLVWAFFFGLIVASFIYIAKQIKRWNLSTFICTALGVIIAVIITSLAPVEAQPHWWFFFVSGAIAICAMILPGISGSFILLLLGMYGHVLNAIVEQDYTLILLFVLGCIVGLMLFSRFLSWLLVKFEQLTFALLSGFLLGSLNLLWPWKQVLTTYVNSSGIEKPLNHQNITPFQYELITGHDSQVLLCCGLAVFGIVLILGIEKLSNKK